MGRLHLLTYFLFEKKGEIPSKRACSFLICSDTDLSATGLIIQDHHPSPKPPRPNMVSTPPLKSRNTDHPTPCDTPTESEADTLTRRNLLELPVEVIYTILDESTLSNALALTLTCTYLYYSHLGAKYRNQAAKPSNEKEEFEVRCILEEAGFIKGYHCQGCLQRHPLHSFTYEEAAKQARERYCLRTKICFRLVPRGYKLSFNELVEVKKQTSRLNIYGSGADLLPHMQDGIACGLLIIKAKYARTKSDFVVHCRGYNVPVCPHMRLADDRIMRLWPPKTYPLKPNPLQMPKVYAQCDFCKTELRLTKSKWQKGKDLWITLGICRFVGDLSSPRDPLWFSQTYAEEDPLLDEYLNVVWNTVLRVGFVRETPWDLEPESGSFYTLGTLPPEPKSWWRKLWASLWAEGVALANSFFRLQMNPSGLRRRRRAHGSFSRRP